MSISTTIRAANARDADNLAVLALQVWLDTYATGGVRAQISSYVLSQFTPKKFRDLLMKEDTSVFVAENGPHLVGFGQLTALRSSEFCHKPRQGEVDRLYVQRPFCRTGLGTKLMGRLERRAFELELDALWLSVWTHNGHARAFYQKLGFADRGSISIPIDNERHENRVFVRELCHDA
jgi:diamine N-acetyltransferase